MSWATRCWYLTAPPIVSASPPRWKRLVIASRHFYERTPWEGPFEMGLEDPVVVWPPCIRRIRFLDPFWHAEVIVLVGDPEQPLDEYLAGATRTIAQWNTETLGGQWSGPVRPPHYPLHWTRLEAS